MGLLNSKPIFILKHYMKLKIAIQKSGRLHDDSIKLLKECGIDISNGVNKLKSEASNFPLEVYFLRDDDIPQYVEDAVADLGFVGENVVYEKEKYPEDLTEKDIELNAAPATRLHMLDFLKSITAGLL